MNIIRISVLTGIALFATGAALADNPAMPHQKLGLWQQTMSMGRHDMSDQVCLDAATESKLSGFGAQMANNKNCQSQHFVHNLDGTWTGGSVCEMRPGWTIASHIVVTGSFDSKYRMVIDSTTTGAPMAAMNGTHQSIITSEWLGPCKPGQKGGDIIMSNGMKVNMTNPAAGMH